MKTGLIAGFYSVTGGEIKVTPNRPLKPDEFVQVSATTGTLGLIDGMGPSAPTVWQFRAVVSTGSGVYTDSGQTLWNFNTTDLGLGDFDGDGDLDLVVANDNDPNEVWINQGGDQGGQIGLFANSGQTLGTERTQGVAVGDVDADGDLDVFFANAVNSPNRVWINDGTGFFIDSGQSLGGSWSQDAAFGDVDGDGDLDIFVANRFLQPNKVWLNDSLGNFTDSGQNLGNSRSTSVSLGDIDGDGDLDAVVANRLNQDNKIWLNDGRGAFTDSGQSVGGTTSHKASIGDIDGDFDLDIFFVNRNNQPNEVWLNDGAGNFSNTGQTLGSSWSESVALGDVDGDGDLDAFVANVTGQANIVWLNNGSGLFADNGQLLGNSSSQQVVLGDLDEDGDLDAVVGNANQPSQIWWNGDVANLAILKTVNVTQAIPGQAITYTLAYTNLGPGIGYDAAILDVIPSELTNLSVISSPPVTPTGSVSFTWGLGDLSPGEFGLITVSGVLTQNLPAGTQISNTGTIQTSSVDSDPSNDQSSSPVVTILNAPPSAIDDAYMVDEDSSLTVSAALGLLANDTDPNGDSLSAQWESGPSNGTLQMGPDGSFVYTPTFNFNGEDFFQYLVSDGQLTDTAGVTVTVNNLNDQPVAVGDWYTMTEDSVLWISPPGVLANDSDPDNTVLTATLDSGPSFGDLSLAADGGLVYTPTLDFNGQDTFRYLVSDGALTDTASVTITVITQADLSVSLSASPSSVQPGELLTYTVTITNLGPSDGINVILQDTLPTTVSLAATSIPCSELAGVVTCDLGLLPEAASTVIDITVLTDPVYTGFLANTVTVWSDDPDPDLTNNTAGINTLVTELVWRIWFPLVGN